MEISALVVQAPARHVLAQPPAQSVLQGTSVFQEELTAQVNAWKVVIIALGQMIANSAKQRDTD